jgi:hypothetical protein
MNRLKALYRCRPDQQLEILRVLRQEGGETFWPKAERIGPSEEQMTD